MPIEMQFYNNVSIKLNKYISHYWYASGHIEKDEGQQLLPMNHSDLMIVCKGDIQYIINDKTITPDNVFFTGIKTKPMTVIQSQQIEMLGISLKPWGLYPFINRDMSKYIDEVVDISKINKEMTDELKDIIRRYKYYKHQNRQQEIIKEIEILLLKNLKPKGKYNNMISYIEKYCETDNENVSEYCIDNNIQRRRFERFFKKYVGTAPKEFQKISKFEDSARTMLFGEENLVDIAIDTGHYDQSHFNKSFKQFSKISPKQFKKEKPALKAKLKYK